jgi:hypothetical protein
MATGKPGWTRTAQPRESRSTRPPRWSRGPLARGSVSTGRSSSSARTRTRHDQRPYHQPKSMPSSGRSGHRLPDVRLVQAAVQHGCESEHVKASLREVAQATLGAWAAGFRKVLNRPFMRVAIPVCSERSHSVARPLNRTRGLAAGKLRASTSGEPSPVAPARVRSFSATLLAASRTAFARAAAARSSLTSKTPALRQRPNTAAAACSSRRVHHGHSDLALSARANFGASRDGQRPACISGEPARHPRQPRTVARHVHYTCCATSSYRS